MTRRHATLLGTYLLVATGLTWLSADVGGSLPQTGLTQTFRQDSIDAPPLFRRTTREIGLAFLDESPDLPRRFVVVTWEGLWYLPDAQTVDLFLGADDRAVLRIDGEVAHERAAGQRTATERIALTAGFHDLDLTYEQYGGGYHLNVQWAPAGEAARPFDPDALFSTRPDDAALAAHRRRVALGRLVPVVWIAPPAAVVLFLGASQVPRSRRWPLAGVALLAAAIVAVGHSYYTHLLPNALAVALGALPFAFPRALRAQRRWSVLYWAGCVAGLIALDVALGVPGGMSDFKKAQYKAGFALLSDPAAAYDAVCGSYAYLPASGLLFVPFGMFDRDTTASLLYIIVGRLTVLAVTYALIQFFRIRDWRLWLVLVLLVFNGPLDRILWLGNSTHFILLLLIGGVAALGSKRWALAGVLFGLAPLLKLSMLLLGGYFVLRRNWRVVGAWAGTLAGAILLSLLGWGYDLHATWIDTCVLQFQGGAIPAFRAQSIDGMLAKYWLPNTSVYDWTAVPVDTTFRVLHYVGVLLVMAPAALAAMRTRDRTEPETTLTEVFIFICAAILISPISWSHYYLLLLLPVAFLAGERHRRRTRPRLVAALLGTLFVVSVVLFSLPEELSVEFYRSYEEENAIARVLLSHYFFGGVLFYIVLLAHRFSGNVSVAPAEGIRDADAAGA